MGLTQRKITGGFYAHGGITIAYLATDQPYSISEVAAALQRAKAAPADIYGR